MNTSLESFVAESNRIEGIHRAPSKQEIDAHARFLGLDKITIGSLQDLVSVLQPGALLRDRRGMDVRVGDHVPLAGGPTVVLRLGDILQEANCWRVRSAPYWVHHQYETLHPFMDGNGRSGRALWLWMMRGQAPLGFLHHWYYQSLQFSGRR